MLEQHVGGYWDQQEVPASREPQCGQATLVPDKLPRAANTAAHTARTSLKLPRNNPWHIGRTLMGHEGGGICQTLQTEEVCRASAGPQWQR